MAIKPYTAWDVSESDKVASFDSTSHVITWPDVGSLAANDVGTPVVMPASADRSIQFAGVPSGATLLCEGSNDGVTYATLNDPLGQPISLAAVGVRQILELTLYVRPRISGGDGSTAITAALLLRRRY